MSGTLQVGGVTLGTHNSGTGKVDLTNAGTLSLGSAASNALTLGTSTTFPAGHIIQVAYGHTATATSVTTTFIDVGLSVDITPTDPTNKILVTAHLNMQINNHGMGIKIFRDSTVIKTTTTYANYTSAGGQVNMRSSYAILDDISDSPAWSSGSITYKIQAATHGGTHTFNESTNYSEIIVMEVVA